MPNPSKSRTAKAAKDGSTSSYDSIMHLTTSKPKDNVYSLTERKFKDLEALHEQTSTLKLTKGQRLKVNSQKQIRRQRRPFHGFDITFADLSDPLSKSNTEAAYHPDDEDDGEDLPEVHDILNTISTSVEARTPSSDMNYSNSEVDSLIRAIPSDDIRAIKVESVQLSKQPGYSPAFLSTPPPPSKRDCDMGPTPPPTKRRKHKIPVNATCSPLSDRCPVFLV